jgi:hypothetical protein
MTLGSRLMMLQKGTPSMAESDNQPNLPVEGCTLIFGGKFKTNVPPCHFRLDEAKDQKQGQHYNGEHLELVYKIQHNFRNSGIIRRMTC